MRRKVQNIAIAVSIGLLVLVVWIAMLGIGAPITSLAYPGPYPPPSMAETVVWQPTPGQGEATPWPSPTPHSFPPPDGPRQGVAAAMDNASLSDRHNFGSWGYYWHIVVPNPYPTNVEHVPMLAHDIRSDLPSFSFIRTMAKRTPHEYWLVFNECENDDPLQCNAPPYEVADFYFSQVVYTMFNSSVPGGQLGADPGADLIIGGVNASPCGITWLVDFVEAYRDITEDRLGTAYDPPRTGWHFHIYPEIVPVGWPDPNDPENGCDTHWAVNSERLSFDNWRQDALNILGFVWAYGAPTDEIWVTETGCLPGDVTNCGRAGFMFDYTSALTGWFNNEGRWVDRYAWYTDWNDNSTWDDTFLYSSIDPSLVRSVLGDYYSQIEPASNIPLPWPTTFIYMPLVKQ